MSRPMGMGMNQSMGMGMGMGGMGPPGAYGNNSMMMGGGMNSSMQMPRPGTGMPAGGGMGMGMGGMGMGMSPQQWASMTPQQQQLWQQQQAMMMQQQGLCGSCQTCCQPTQPGMPVDTFICGNEAAPTVNALNPLETTCDCATIATFFFALLSIVGFGVSVGLKDPDSIFSIYNETAPVNTAELQQRMINDIPYLLYLQNLSNERTNNLTRRIITIPITTTTTATTTTSTTTRPPTTTVVSTTSSSSSTTIPSAGALAETFPSPATAQPLALLSSTKSTLPPPATISYGVDYTSKRRALSGQSAMTRAPHDGEHKDYFEGSEEDSSRGPQQERRRAFGRLDSFNITVDESINYLNVPADPLWSQPCLTTRGLSGTFGKVCVEQALTASAFYFQLYNWTVFRDTLYFIAMCGSILTLILIYMIHRQKNPPFGSPQHQKMLMDQSHGGQGFMGGQGMQRPPPMGMGMNASMQQFGNNNAGMMGGMPNGGAMPGMGMITDVPIKFADTNFFLAFRFAWGCASVVIFLWVATQMYAFWTMINAYKEFTRNELHSFWVDYEKKFVGTVVCVTIYLCWPLAHLCLEIGLFVVFFIPWYGFRSMCKPGVENVRYPVETPLDVIPGWVRIDMFFTEFRQLQRLGFSVQMWHLLTGSYEPFFEVCETPNPNLQMMPNPLGGDGVEVEGNKGGTPSLGTSTIGINNINVANNAMFMGGGAGGARGSNTGLDQSGMFPTANNNGISPTKSSGRKDRSENKDNNKSNKEHSEHKRDRSKSKDREGKSKGRSSGGVDTSAAFESSTMLNMTNGGNFSPSEREDNGGKRRDKSEKKEKKDKGERSSSKRDKADKSESSKKEKSKSKRDKKDKSGDSGVYPLDE